MLFVYLALALLIAVVDQIIKYFVLVYLKPIVTVSAIPYILDFVYVENTGVAFGMFKDLRWFFVILTAALIITFIVFLCKNYEKSSLLSYSAVLIIGGGIGNLVDRITHGFVVDYLQLSFFPPICNFADYCITAGTIMLVVYMLFYSDMKSDIKFKDKK